MFDKYKEGRSTVVGTTLEQQSASVGKVSVSSRKCEGIEVDDGLTEDTVWKLKYQELQVACKQMGLSAVGNTQVLIDKLQKWFQTRRAKETSYPCGSSSQTTIILRGGGEVRMTRFRSSLGSSKDQVLFQ
ncbi:hypothetical protein R1sor_000638 [Riccia sorocarpa]|uniref:SAP domain-containing protein n=1 Tax=Riccia sorocarpa TaxID=122646 RepID=A0ABD3GXV4_9MARC